MDNELINIIVILENQLQKNMGHGMGTALRRASPESLDIYQDYGSIFLVESWFKVSQIDFNRTDIFV